MACTCIHVIYTCTCTCTPTPKTLSLSLSLSLSPSLSLSSSPSLSLPHPEEPEDEVLLLSHCRVVSVPRNGIAKQPEPQSPRKYVNVFLEKGIVICTVCLPTAYMHT